MAVWLVNDIAEGELVEDVGPQLTPNREHVTMSYDAAANLLQIEIYFASRVLRPAALATGIMRVSYDEPDDLARLYFVEEAVGDSELLKVGPQLTPTRDRITLAYDKDDYLVYVEVEGADRVLRAETLAAAS